MEPPIGVPALFGYVIFMAGRGVLDNAALREPVSMSNTMTRKMIVPSAKAKVLEIFKSIQGEGPYAGVQQIFVRFFECNMHCTWCDTPHSIGDTTRHYQEYDADELMDQIIRLSEGCHSVSITGGEPLLQKDFIKKIIPKIREQKLKIYLDTNGTLPEALAEIIDGVDTIAMDIKLPSSTKCQAYWKEHKDFLDIARRKEVFIKAVVSLDTSEEDIVQAVNLVKSVDRNILFILQPNYFQMKEGSVEKCLEFFKICSRSLNDVRILPQVHKFMKVR